MPRKQFYVLGLVSIGIVVEVIVLAALLFGSRIGAPNQTAAASLATVKPLVIGEISQPATTETIDQTPPPDPTTEELVIAEDPEDRWHEYKEPEVYEAYPAPESDPTETEAAYLDATVPPDGYMPPEWDESSDEDSIYDTPALGEPSDSDVIPVDPTETEEPEIDPPDYDPADSDPIPTDPDQDFPTDPVPDTPAETEVPPDAGPQTPTPTQPAIPTTQAPTNAPTTVTTAAPTAPVTGTPSPASTNSPAPTQTPENPGSLLSSARVSSGPRLDGAASDPAWASAPAVTIQTSGGANQSATTVTVKSVHDDQRVYFLLTWADPTQSFVRNPWEKQKDGSWKKLTGADNSGGDENQYFEDQIAFLWPIQNGLPDFTARGCGTACHSGGAIGNGGAKPLGVMRTDSSGKLADRWHWKSVRSVNQVDDEYLDSAKYSQDNPEAGLHTDPGSGGDRANQSEDRESPAYMPPGGGDKNGYPGYILESDKVSLDEKRFKAGDLVPSFLVSALEGDRGDISAGWKYADGQWTLEISRKLVTGSKYDVQFSDLGLTYPFALATFDNTQFRHASQSGATALKFDE